MVSQAIGLGVELLEGQLALLGADGDGLRGALRLGLDQRVQGTAKVMVGAGRIEGVQHPLAFFASQQVDVRDDGLVAGRKGLQDALQVTGEAFDCGAVEQRGGIHDATGKAAGPLTHAQAQIELGHFGLGSHGADMQVCKRRGPMPGVGVPVQRCLIQRRMSKASPRAQ